jgi:Saccharopine dehydrogenase NADP binding domain
MNEKTLLILGGSGNTGRPLTRLILQETDAHIVLAGRNVQKASNLTAEFNQVFPGERVSWVFADAADSASLERAFQGADLVVVASSTARYAREVANAALAAGIDTLDIQYSTQKITTLKSLSAEIEKAGRCFITDGGFHPGLPAALVRYSAESFESLEKAQVGSVIKEDWASLSLPDETVHELIEELNDFKLLVFKEGHWKKAGMLGMQDYLRMDFGREFGQQYCAPMFLEEMRSLPEMIPSLKETGFYVGGFNWFVDWLVMPLAMLGLRIWPKGALKPMGKLMVWGLRNFSRPPYGTLLKIEAQGIYEAKTKNLQITLYHPDGYLFTAIPVAACLLQYLDGSIKKPGLWMQANLVEPTRLMQDMQRMGIEIWRSDGNT